MDVYNRETCRETEHCNGKVWYINGAPFGLAKDGKSLTYHKCFHVPPSAFPTTVYVGLWKNPNTGRTRYVGPTKTERNARKAPDNFGTWEFIGVMHCTPEWTEMEDKTTTYKTNRTW